MAARRVPGLSGLRQAFDEIHFGATRTLNLRLSLPTASEAASRLERWLRQHQVQQSGEVLVITGRGNNSVDGISVVREASIRVFHEMRRKGVIEGFSEHTAGSFAVTRAPVKAMFDAVTLDAAKHAAKRLYDGGVLVAIAGRAKGLTEAPSKGLTPKPPGG